MKRYQIIKITEMWSTDTLMRNAEAYINIKSNEGFEIVTVSFGVNLWWMPTAYITICR